MNKSHVLSDLSSYLDDQLSVKVKLKVESHLKECKMCTQELARLKTLSEKLKAWQAPDLDSEFDNALVERIVREDLKGGRVKMKTKTLAILVPSGALVGLLALFFCVGLLRQGLMEKQASIDVSGQYVTTEILSNEYAAGSKAMDVKTENLNRGVIGMRNQKYKTSSPKIYSKLDKFKDKVVNLARPQQEIGSYEIFDEGHMSKQYSYTSGYAGSDLSIRQLARSSREEDAYEFEKHPVDYSRVRGQVADGQVTSLESAAYNNGSVIVIQPTMPATGEGDKIIRTGEITVEVEDGTKTYKKANEICQELGGYIASSNFYKDDKGRESGSITMRIPKDNFLTALDKLGALGKVDHSATNSQDVSQEYANIKAQLDAAMVVYDKTLEALQRRKITIPEAMRLESELTPILRRVQNLKNQLEYLDNAVSFTTINLTFHEAEISQKVLEETRESIKQGMLSARIDSVRLFAKAIPSAITIVIWIILIFGIAFSVKYLIARLFKR